MRTRQELIEQIFELNNTIASAEYDQEMDGHTNVDIDSLRCQVADLRIELRDQLTPMLQRDNVTESN